MNQTISIDGKTFKQFRDTQYYCDDLGNIYSNFSKRILKPMLRGPKIRNIIMWILISEKVKNTVWFIG